MIARPRAIGVVVLALIACAWGAPGRLGLVGRARAATDEWTTSLHDPERTAASDDTTISPSAASGLGLLWSFQTGGPVATTPTVSGGVAYFGSWDGYEYAVSVASGALDWKTYLGLTDAPSNCTPSGEVGISSPATVAGGVVYVGGGDGYFYALDAGTGAVDWRAWLGGSGTPGTYDGHYNWSGPLVIGNYAYVGVASFGDCPLIQGQLLQINLTSGKIVNTLNLVPNGQVGGGIWTSPAYDPSTNEIFTDTGTENDRTQQWAQALLAVDKGSLEVKDSWKLPESAAVEDSDFGTSTTLFDDAAGDPLVVAINKNGMAYAFRRNQLAAGPVWQQQIALGGDCPTCGESSVSSGAFGGGALYLGGNNGVIDGTGYPGTVRALDPATGDFLWQHAAPGSVIGALAYDNGMVLDGGGPYLEILDATTGHRLYSYNTGSQIYAGPSVADGMILVGNTAGQVDAFGEPASEPLPPPPDSSCPTGDTCQDIGAPSPSGWESVADGTWSISAAGAGVGGRSDSFRLMSTPTSGDEQLSATLAAVPGGGGQAGLMIRQSNDPGSPYYAVLAEAPDTLVVQYRTAFGGPTTTAATTTIAGGGPIQLMIQRVGDRFQSATSDDGSDYQLVPGSDADLPLPDISLAGLAVSSGTQGTAADVTVSAFDSGPPQVSLSLPATPSGCPDAWSCADVGNPSQLGDQSLSSGTWTLSGVGTGIGRANVTQYSEWPVDDQFHFVWQSLSGDGTISAQVSAPQGGGGDAQSGLMLRADASGGAAYYGAWLTPQNDVVIDYRTTQGLLDDEIASLSTTGAAWIEIARSGDVFTTYTSTDGVSWQPVTGSSVALPNLPATVLAGMALSADSATALSTATFGSVTFAGDAPQPPNLCPTGWACNDIGFPTPAGDQSYADRAWTVQGGGGDITDTADSFRFVSESQETDGTVSAEVDSQDDTNGWAKSGVMIRESTSGGSPYYAVLVTPQNGVVVQYRTQEGAGTSQLAAGAATGPLYVEVDRSGDVYTAYTSSDGSNWTEVSGSATTIPALVGTLQAGLAVCSHDALALSTTVFTGVTITGITGTGGLPGQWADQDVGAPSPAGSASYAGGTFTVQGSGSDIWGDADQFNYVSEPLSGDGSIIARVASQSPTDPWAKAGIMIKQSTDAGSPYAMVAVTPANGAVFQYGFTGTTGGRAYAFPDAWLRLDRSGDLFTAYQSVDGTNWVEIGQTTIQMDAGATVGLFVTSHDPGTLSTATFDSVTVTATGGGQVPSPWSSGDVGAPALPGDASYTGGAFTLSGSGDDVWGDADQFQYAWQPLNGDGSITARVMSQDPSDPWAKAGVMIKQSTTAGDPYAMLAVTPGNGMVFQSDFTNSVNAGSYTLPNAWLRLTRTGDTITAYDSSDGSTWTQIGSETVKMSSAATIGLFVTSHDGSALSTATFDNVTVTSAGGALPAPWSSGDVGSPQLGGDSTVAGGVYTVTGAGDDVWGDADQFQYAWQPLNGDGSITARVMSQDPSDPWAKAGVMIKQSTTAGDPYAMLAVTPANGMVFQSDFTNSIGGGFFAFPDAWLRLTRAGDTITAYDSSDGSTWTQIGSDTVSLSATATIGLFVTSHNWDALSTATFDNVTVDAGGGSAS